MRKQYNLRKSEDGLKAWDVYRLIELSKDLPVKKVLLSDIKDGMHRIIKALLKESTTIKAVQFEMTPEPDFINIPVDDLPY